MGVGTRRHKSAVTAGSTGRYRSPEREHPLLTLQRSAGNQAVAALVQRRKEPRGKPNGSSRVALAPMDDLYKGKCDAEMQGATLSYEWSRGLLGKDVYITFECGPASFRFKTFYGYFDDDHFPWTLKTVDGGSGWVVETIAHALDDIKADIDDTGPKYWAGYHLILDGLTADLNAYCEA